jgi:thiamine transporter
MRDTKVLVLVEVALAVALAVVLNFIQIRLPFNIAGGSVNLCMLPIAVVALRRGPLAGAIAGALFGGIDLLLEPFILFPLQVILDYPAPYLLFGLGVGLFSKLYRTTAERDGQRISGRFVLSGTAVIVAALLVGAIARLSSHVISGVLFFAEYAADFFVEYPNLLQAGPLDAGLNVWIYSLIYNLLYIIPSTIAALICALVIAPVLAKTVPVRKLKAARAQ